MEWIHVHGVENATQKLATTSHIMAIENHYKLMKRRNETFSEEVSIRWKKISLLSYGLPESFNVFFFTKLSDFFLSENTVELKTKREKNSNC